MPRRSIERSVSGTGSFIDMKTGQSVEKTGLPVICYRIRFFREKAGFEQKELAKKIGVTANAVSNWENGRGRPDLNLIPDICEALNITLYDLYALENPSLPYSDEEQHLVSRYRGLTPGHRLAVSRMTDTLLEVQETENIPLIRKLTFYERSLAAGIGDPTEFETAGKPVYLYSSRKVDRADCVFRVNGDSMEPDYHDSDLVLVSRIPDAPDLQPGEVGAFIVGNETYIKVRGEDSLISLNPAYEPMRFDSAEAVYLIGRVTGVLNPEEIATDKDIERYLRLHSE